MKLLNFNFSLCIIGLLILHIQGLVLLKRHNETNIKQNIFTNFLPNEKASNNYVPIFVMLELDTVNPRDPSNLNDPNRLNNELQQLKDGGVYGVMADMWWGVVEHNGPKQYNWNGYKQLADLCQKHGLKLNPVLSFHMCGGNVGDACNNPIPQWARDVPDAFFKDKHGRTDYEYISFGADDLPIFQGRTPIQIYSDYMNSFAEEILKHYPDTIRDIEVSLGPSGELRYPSYPLSEWKFPGVGEFQVYDKYMASALQDHATKMGHSEWGHAGPDNAGDYSSTPESAQFWNPNGFDNFKSDYGRFFLTWYKDTLLTHGDKVLKAAKDVFGSYQVGLSGKISGIHWLYNTEAHAAEATAGYVNTDGINTYYEAGQLFKKYGVTFDFTCLEMKDNEQPGNARSSPENLIRQVKAVVRDLGIKFEGENALPRYDEGAFNQIAYQLSSDGVTAHGFTYLRIGNDLLNGNNWETFKRFIQRMH